MIVNLKGKDLTKNLNVLIERVLCWLPAPIAGHGVPFPRVWFDHSGPLGRPKKGAIVNEDRFSH